MKDETAGSVIKEFVELTSKMHSHITDNNKGGETAKGIKKNVIKKNIKHEDCRNTLFNKNQIRHRSKIIRSQRNQIGSYEINKVSLSCFDDKRDILDDGINTRAYCHYET